MADPMPGTVSFLEIGSGNLAATQKFFGAVFDWPCRDDMWFQTPAIKAGTHGNDPAPQIYVYFHVADLDAAAARVRAAGGEASAIKDEGAFGRFVNCKDPGGIAFGLHQASG
jgi:predicted enzyme related to lactoylglutathione lyase